MPTTHGIKTWVLVACVMLIFVGIGAIILPIYILVKLSQPATTCVYCEGNTYPIPPVAYAPAPAYGYAPYPAAGWQPVQGGRHCPHCYQPVPAGNRYCPSCGRNV